MYQLFVLVHISSLSAFPWVRFSIFLASFSPPAAFGGFGFRSSKVFVNSSARRAALIGNSIFVWHGHHALHTPLRASERSHPSPQAKKKKLVQTAVYSYTTYIHLTTYCEVYGIKCIDGGNTLNSTVSCPWKIRVHHAKTQTKEKHSGAGIDSDV